MVLKVVNLKPVKPSRAISNLYARDIALQIKSAVRGVNRGMNVAEGGRWVPSELMLAMTDNEENFIKMIPEFTKWSIYDNDVPFGTRAKMIAKS